jgi:hypothetical protein
MWRSQLSAYLQHTWSRSSSNAIADVGNEHLQMLSNIVAAVDVENEYAMEIIKITEHVDYISYLLKEERKNSRKVRLEDDNYSYFKSCSG